MGGKAISTLELRRLALQQELDARKPRSARNRLGQFATPTPLARDVLGYAVSQLGDRANVRFLDPAIGTGAFYSALRSTVSGRRIESAAGLEIDPHYGEPSAGLWEDSGLTYRFEDFTKARPDPRFNLLICNPPYVRHHHLKTVDKPRLAMRTLAASGMKLSGLAGLYCHFIGLAHAWMEQGALAGWLIPSEFMDVNYGRELKRYLLERVTLLHVHRFDPTEVQFADALVSSAIVWFRKALPALDHPVRFTFGGTLLAPRLARTIPAGALRAEGKWTRYPRASARSTTTRPVIADFFRIKRGLATGDNGYFILSRQKIVERGLPMQAFRPILPSPRYLPNDKVGSDRLGNPLLERQLFLLDIGLSEEEIGRRYPSLRTYLEEGKQQALHDRYLCRHRAPWYAQEKRPAAPIVCTYLGRGSTARNRPFRFILNHSKATAANVYLMMYPIGALAEALRAKPALIERVWSVLNEIRPQQLLRAGRVYGGGLHKLEPKELSNVPVPGLGELVPRLKATPSEALRNGSNS
jgi:adenine-specific DNA-methyltransferase